MQSTYANEEQIQNNALSMLFEEDYLYNPLLATTLKCWKPALLFSFIQQEMIDREEEYVSLSDHARIKRRIGFGRTELRLTKLELLERRLISKTTRNREALFSVNLGRPGEITREAGIYSHEKFHEIKAVNVKPLHIASFKTCGGDARCAILIGAILEYLPPSHGAHRSAWIVLDQEVIMERTGLSIFHQKIARDNLTAFGVLEAKKEGYPIVHYFRVNYEQLGNITYDYVESNFYENQK